MKIIKKVGILITFTIIYSIFSCYTVYADPNSSKGFAEYDDVKAEEENQKMIEEQEKEQESIIGKSTNNYLENLGVDGYEISPQFDKQTLGYTIKGDVKAGEEITIKATPSDSKAKVEGTGNIKLVEGQNQYRIDVTAESGTVRTYIIKIENLKKTEQNQNIVEENEEIPTATEEISTIPEEDDSKENIGISIIIIIVIVISIAIIIKVRKVIKKGKHE